MWKRWAERWRSFIARSEETQRELDDAEGQGLVEYALILSLVVIVAFIVVTWIGPWVGNVFSNVVHML